jgi:hypothetical protein
MKQSLRHLGVNINEKTADIEAKALKGILDLVESHNLDLGLKKPSGYHKDCKSDQDIKQIVGILKEKRMFQQENGRSYASFPKMTRPLLASLDVHKLKVWMEGHIKKWKYEENKRLAAPY